MKDKIVAFLSNTYLEFIISFGALVLALIDGIANSAQSFDDLNGWAKVCTIISMTIFALLFVKGMIVPGVVALLKLLKIVK